MNIKFLDFHPSHSEIRAEILEALAKVYDSNWYILGKEVQNFENAYAQYSKTKHCIGVANGLEAIHLSLKAIGVEPGDEVIVPSNTYIATVLAVTYAGATPVFVEPRLTSYNINPELIEPKITSKTKAIIPVHLYGLPCEMDAILNISKKHNLSIVEDNAQSQGATFNGKMTGSFGLANATSFYPGKNLGALGDAGAITTDSDEMANKLKILRNYGSEKKYFNSVIGYNSRLDEMQAAVLSVKLKHLNNWTSERVKIAEKYKFLLKGIPGLEIPQPVEGATHVYHQFIIRCKNRDELKNRLIENGVETLIHYPIPPHLQEAYSSLGFKEGSFPIAEEISSTVLSLPIYIGLKDEQIEYICDVIKDFFQSKN